MELPVSWKAGQEYFYQLEVTLEYLYPKVRETYELRRVSPETGRQFVSDCRYTPPMNLEKVNGVTPGVPTM